MAARHPRMREPRQCAADKNPVGTAVLLPVQLRDPDENLLADLRALASRMLRQGHRPCSFLLVRLTDGRIKMVHSEGGSKQTEEDLRRITNEHGPVGTAFRIWTEEDGAELVACVENIAGSREAIVGQAPVPSGSPLIAEKFAPFGIVGDGELDPSLAFWASMRRQTAVKGKGSARVSVRF